MHESVKWKAFDNGRFNNNIKLVIWWKWTEENDSRVSELILKHLCFVVVQLS